MPGALGFARVVRSIVGLSLPCIGFALALWFLFSTSTSVRRVAQLGSRPGFPGMP